MDATNASMDLSHPLILRSGQPCLEYWTGFLCPYLLNAFFVSALSLALIRLYRLIRAMMCDPSAMEVDSSDSPSTVQPSGTVGAWVAGSFGCRLRCCICNQGFNDGARLPRQLDECEHSICQSCGILKLRSSSCIECPCGRSTIILNVDHLPVDSRALVSIGYVGAPGELWDFGNSGQQVPGASSNIYDRRNYNPAASSADTPGRAMGYSNQARHPATMGPYSLWQRCAARTSLPDLSCIDNSPVNASLLVENTRSTSTPPATSAVGGSDAGPSALSRMFGALNRVTSALRISNTAAATSSSSVLSAAAESELNILLQAQAALESSVHPDSDSDDEENYRNQELLTPPEGASSSSGPIRRRGVRGRGCHPPRTTRYAIAANDMTEDEKSKNCAICMDSMQEVSPYGLEIPILDEKPIVRLPCAHLLHRSCAEKMAIVKWREQGVKCPLCRKHH